MHCAGADMRLVEKNTFLNAVVECEEGDEFLYRTISDPTGRTCAKQPPAPLPPAFEEPTPNDVLAEDGDHPLKWLTPTPPPSPRLFAMPVAQGASSTGPGVVSTPTQAAVYPVSSHAPQQGFGKELESLLCFETVELKSPTPPRRRRGARGHRHPRSVNAEPEDPREDQCRHVGNRAERAWATSDTKMAVRCRRPDDDFVSPPAITPDPLMPNLSDMTMAVVPMAAHLPEKTLVPVSASGSLAFGQAVMVPATPAVTGPTPIVPPIAVTMPGTTAVPPVAVPLPVGTIMASSQDTCQAAFVRDTSCEELLTSAYTSPAMMTMPSTASFPAPTQDITVSVPVPVMSMTMPDMVSLTAPAAEPTMMAAMPMMPLHAGPNSPTIQGMPVITAVPPVAVPLPVGTIMASSQDTCQAVFVRDPSCEELPTTAYTSPAMMTMPSTTSFPAPTKDVAVSMPVPVMSMTMPDMVSLTAPAAELAMMAPVPMMPLLTGPTPPTMQGLSVPADEGAMEVPHVPVVRLPAGPKPNGRGLASSKPLARLCSPPFGMLHRFHRETDTMGHLSEDARQFRKENFSGRLSVVTEDQIHSKGTMRYCVQFTGGELSAADGVGFILSSKLPCPKNIQRIVSIFANRTGRICIRAQSEVIRSDIGVRPIEIGDWVAVTVNLDELIAEFAVWPAGGGQPSTAAFHFATALETMRARIPGIPNTTSGYFACVVKHVGVSMKLGS
eukprot:CAMPEP_0115225072 /NCGR_PEP_ID=MMETSP0270-20121206/29910_1 /TAXON_ID=71861 /ORGANISM="Scrippsiella trochoidea, Strain CCMP3099" /LENGTH=723 /DNA_ID=CAMNT_0002639419 /DNA_START=83 /DNA_END=2254 /DNA_ORIENTATION=+